MATIPRRSASTRRLPTRRITAKDEEGRKRDRGALKESIECSLRRSKEKNKKREEEKEEREKEKEKEREKEKEKAAVTDVWPGEAPARTFTEFLSVIRFKLEFDEVCSLPVDLKICKEYFAHPKRNRGDRRPHYDSNMVKPNGTTTANYVNATKLSIPKFPKQVIFAQLPVSDAPGATEDFWRMVFEEQATTMYILATKEESKSNFSEYFPITHGEHQTFGEMWLNNRKIEEMKQSDCTVYTMEVLPVNCSNSIMLTVYLYYGWPETIGPSGYAKLMKVIQPLYKEGPETTTILASLHGSGRPGTCISIAIAIHLFNSGQEPKVREIVKMIRRQRPHAVDSIQHYGFIYLSLCFYLKRKLIDKTIIEKAEQFMHCCNNQFY